MLRRAIDKGVSKERLARAFSVNLSTINSRISTDPIEDDEGDYIAKFKITGAGLKQGKSGASRRNFVDED